MPRRRNRAEGRSAAVEIRRPKQKNQLRLRSIICIFYYTGNDTAAVKKMNYTKINKYRVEVWPARQARLLD